MTKHKSEDYKLTAVEYYLIENKSQEEVCKIFNCTPRSLMRWVDKYQETGNVERHNRKPKAYKVHKEHIKFLLNEIKKNKTITMEDLQVKLKLSFPELNITRRHIGRIIRDNNITLKICVVVKSTPLYLSLSFCNNSCSVMVLLFLSSCNKKTTYSFFTLYATGFL